MKKIEDKMNELYSEFLIEEYSDELHCKDQLIDAEENGVHRDEFEIQVLRGMGFTVEEIKGVASRGYEEKDVDWGFRNK